MATMQIHRLRIEQVRQFRQPYEVTGLSPGLNIFSGPNEAGKSTLVRAIRAAFFERYRSTSVDDLKPWGDSSASPEIELDFSINGIPYRLVKRFFGRKRCDLTVGNRELEGQEAEDLLAQTLGFTYPGRGASKPEQWGIPGLLWVEQGTGQDLDVSHAQDHLGQALNCNVGEGLGELAASRGDELLQRMLSLRGELLTQEEGKPRGRYKEAIQQEAALMAQMQNLNEQIQTYQAQVDELSGLRTQEHNDENDRPWEALAVRLEQARENLKDLEQLQQAIDADKNRLRALNQNRQLLMAQLAAFDQRDNDLIARGQQVERLQDEHDAQKAAFDAAQEQWQQATEKLRQARAMLSLARQEATHAELQRQLEQAERQAAQFTKSLQGAEKAQTRIEGARIDAEAIRITRRDVDHLGQLELAVREAKLRLQVMATRVNYELSPGKQIAISGEDLEDVLAGEGTILVEATTRFELQDLGVVTITPGGEDLTSLLAEHADAQEKLQSGLQLLGLNSVGEAHERLQRYEDLNRLVKQAEAELAIHAPEGVQAVREQARVSASAVLRLQLAMEQLPATPVDVKVPELKQAETDNQTATQVEEAAQTAFRNGELALAQVRTRLEHVKLDWQALQIAQADPNRMAQRREADTALISMQAEIRTLEHRLTEARASLAMANPEIARQDIQRLESSIQEMEKERQDRRDRTLLLINTLEIAGAQGLEERRAALAGDLDRALKRVHELDTRAKALDWLCRTIQRRRQETVMRLQAPLVQRMHRYLTLLFPGSTIEVGENLAPVRLMRQAGAGLATDTPETLSFGAREQLGLISRFAYADLLAEAGKPTLLILDDALVHSDEQRLAQMKRVLFDAAQRHQILLFTCHPMLWRDMGTNLRFV